MKKSKKKIIFSIIIVSFLAGLILIGIALGYFLAIRSTRVKVRQQLQAKTLGAVFSSEMQQRISEGYKDPEEALLNMENYLWVPENRLVPFVGTAPMPGHHHSAIINSDHFRYPGEVKLPKDSGLYRIFLTGGSTAFGVGAPSNNHTIGGYLETLLNKNLSQKTNRTFQVITAANPAWSSTHERILIENKISEMEPDLVVSFSGLNDVHWAWEGRSILWFQTYSEAFFWWLANKAYRSAGFGRMNRYIDVSPEPLDPNTITETLIKNIQFSHKALSIKGVPYVFFLQPVLGVTKKSLSPHENSHRDRILGKDKAAYFDKSYQQFHRDLAQLKLSQFSFVPLVNIFDMYGADETIFIDSYHFGDKGNEIIARKMFWAIAPLIHQ